MHEQFQQGKIACCWTIKGHSWDLERKIVEGKSKKGLVDVYACQLLNNSYDMKCEKGVDNSCAGLPGWCGTPKLEEVVGNLRLAHDWHLVQTLQDHVLSYMCVLHSYYSIFNSKPQLQ